MSVVLLDWTLALKIERKSEICVSSRIVDMYSVKVRGAHDDAIGNSLELALSIETVRMTDLGILQCMPREMRVP